MPSSLSATVNSQKQNLLELALCLCAHLISHSVRWGVCLCFCDVVTACPCGSTVLGGLSVLLQAPPRDPGATMALTGMVLVSRN